MALSEFSKMLINLSIPKEETYKGFEILDRKKIYLQRV